MPMTPAVAPAISGPSRVPTSLAALYRPELAPRLTTARSELSAMPSVLATRLMPRHSP